MNTKIAIGIPTLGTIKTSTVITLVNIIQNLSCEIFVIFRFGNHISESRERMVKSAKENKCSHIFFIDSDMKFHFSVLSSLLKQNKDIIGATYNYKVHPLTSMVKLFPNEKKMDKTLKVAGMPTGCLLIKMSVFEKIEKPYFPMEYDKEGFVACSSDIGFCEKARKFGFDIWCDFTLVVKHIGDYEF